MLKGMFTGISKINAFTWRRERINVPVWILSLLSLTFFVALTFPHIYPAEQRQVLAETMKNPAITAMFGIGYGLDNYHYGAIMGHQMSLFTALGAAIMSILLVNRHTRGDEEEGRTEVVGSCPVGRLSGLGATLAVACAANILLALATGIGLYALGLEGIDLPGSLLYGALIGVTGIFFAASTALFAQITATPRGTLSFSFAYLGISYLLRAIGDVSSETLSMLSPLGWVLRSQVYVNNYWWPIFLTLGAAILVGALAFYLNSMRDMGAGFIHARRGRTHAPASLRSPLGLGLRLQRGVFIAWAIGMYVLGASYGSVLGDIDAFFTDNEMMLKMIPGGPAALSEQYIAMIMAALALMSTIPALFMILKIRDEEKKNRAEHLLVRAVPRPAIMLSFLGISVVTGFAVLMLGATGLWSAGLAVLDEPLAFGPIFSAVLAYYPAILGLIGLAAVLVGVAPKAASLIWYYLGYTFITAYFGNLLQLPEWMRKLTSFGFVPQVPVESMGPVAATGLTAVALGLMAIGVIEYSKRDMVN